MPKNIHTPREELVCGKLDRLMDLVVEVQRKNFGQPDNEPSITTNMAYLIRDIRHDCERMEQKLISRKEEARQLKDL